MKFRRLVSACVLAVLLGASGTSALSATFGWADKFVIAIATVTLDPGGGGQAAVHSAFVDYWSFSDVGLQARIRGSNAVTKVGWHHSDRAASQTSVLETYVWRYRSLSGHATHSFGATCNYGAFGGLVYDGSRSAISDTNGWNWTGAATGVLELPHTDQDVFIGYSGAPYANAIWWEYVARVWSTNNAAAATDNYACYTILWGPY